MELKENILEATIRVFNQKGLKFTMDDIASELSISKKTIYTVFSDKETMFLAMVDYCFDQIKDSEAKVLSDSTLSTYEKIHKILIVLPDSYREVDLSQLYALREKFPKVYMKVEERLESGWEATFDLMRQGMHEGVIRPVNLIIFKTMLESTIEQFFRRDILAANHLSYNDAMEELAAVLMQGIKA